jgi:hypothetical protein
MLAKQSAHHLPRKRVRDLAASVLSLLRNHKNEAGVSVAGLAYAVIDGGEPPLWVKSGNPCAGRPARSRWCKSATMKE